MKVLAVYSTDHLLGGGEISFTLTLKAVLAAGHDVLAIVPADGPLGQYLTANGIRFEIARQESMRNVARLRRLIWPSADWLRIVNDYRPDLIHCNAIRSALFGQAVGRRFGIPTILHARVAQSDPTDRFLMFALDGIICTSTVVRKRFANRPGRARIRVIYNAVDVAELENVGNAAEELRRQWMREDDDILIGLPGRLSPHKGQKRLVAAAPAILQGCPQARFVFIGDEDPSFPGYTGQLHSTTDGHFIFAGFHQDMASVYNALDMVVFPTSSEAFGRVVIEAGAARRPLVVNDLEVMREILPKDSGDFVVDCDNPRLFADKVLGFLRSPALRSDAADRLHDHVANTFSIETHRDKVLALYKEILA